MFFPSGFLNTKFELVIRFENGPVAVDNEGSSYSGPNHVTVKLPQAARVGVIPEDPVSHESPPELSVHNNQDVNDSSSGDAAPLCGSSKELSFRVLLYSRRFANLVLQQPNGVEKDSGPVCAKSESNDLVNCNGGNGGIKPVCANAVSPRGKNVYTVNDGALQQHPKPYEVEKNPPHIHDNIGWSNRHMKWRGRRRSPSFYNTHHDHRQWTDYRRHYLPLKPNEERYNRTYRDFSDEGHSFPNHMTTNQRWWRRTYNSCYRRY
ncbi:hypothetical protein OSTOST_17559 [Ostertagia ostertagi]